MSRKFTRDEIERIRTGHRLENVISRYTDLKSAGRDRLKGLCPFHEDTDASFFVYTDNQSWYCFGCHAGRDIPGSHDVFKFLMVAERVTFPEAVERLATGISTTTVAPVRRSQPKPTPGRVLTGAERHLLTAAAEVFHTHLLAYQPALDYLARRGFDMEGIRRRKVGYASGNRLRKYLRFKGWDEEIAAGLNLLEEAGGREYFRNRIIIPEWRDGTVIYLAGRALGNFNPKYLFMNDVPKPIYGVELVAGDEVFVTEGVFDWLTLLRWGYPAVCLLGTWLKKSYADFFDGFNRIYAAFDNDRAGREAAARLRGQLGKRVQMVALPDGVKDIGELGEQPGGRRRFERCLTTTQNNNAL